MAMTSVNVTGNAGSETAQLPADRKAVLICPRCSHESPVGGDWILLPGENAVDVHCPDCRARLARRPR